VSDEARTPALRWLAIFDPRLCSLDGHSSNYAHAVASAAAGVFDRISVFADRAYLRSASPHEVNVIPENTALRSAQRLVSWVHSRRDTGALPNARPAGVPSVLRMGWLALRAAGLAGSLERALGSLGAAADDEVHVLIQQADFIELAAAQVLIDRRRLATARPERVIVHLILRHGPEITRAGLEPEVAFARRLARLGGGGSATRIHFHSDSALVADAFAALRPAPGPVGVLPIPLPPRARAIARRQHGAGRARLRLAVLGDSRVERGFGILDKMIGRFPASFAGRRLEIAVQVNRGARDQEVRRVIRWLDRARAEGNGDGPSIELLEGPVGEDAYFAWIGCTDILIAPLLSAKYACSTSGVFADALYCGVPSVVPDGTWAAGVVQDAARRGLHIGAVSRSLEEIPAACRALAGRLPETTEQISCYVERHFGPPPEDFANRLLAPSPHAAAVLSA
jgi:hypothetical protein